MNDQQVPKAHPTNEPKAHLRANVFGDGRAEQDRPMLDRTFYEWQDYKTLQESNDRFVVVGRRGTGKSALTYKLAKEWHAQKRVTLVIAPTEQEVIGLRAVATLFGQSLTRIRAGVKLAWRYALLLELAAHIDLNYKTRPALQKCQTTLAHLRAWRGYGESATDRLKNCLREKLIGDVAPEERIGDLSRLLNINRITCRSSTSSTSIAAML